MHHETPMRGFVNIISTPVDFDNGEEIAVSAREVHKVLDLAGTDFPTWFPCMASQARLTGGKDFVSFDYTFHQQDTTPEDPYPNVDFILTIEAAKKIALLGHYGDDAFLYGFLSNIQRTPEEEQARRNGGAACDYYELKSAANQKRIQDRNRRFLNP